MTQQIYIEDEDDQAMELKINETVDVGATAAASTYCNTSPTPNVEPLDPLQTW